ncbi:MAG: PD-(D/E)XK nuclease family transposase [Spirochaetes bacterium]|nr:PD-(D/E)XK nuclease family transposase [Spirochaetota bacterium]MBN2771117.1 PD-(D/E)XK nuclease family transposase [Spirochaetota bacterium]
MYNKLKPICCINLLNFKLLEDTEKFHSCYVLKEKTSQTKFLPITLYFILLSYQKEYKSRA